MSASIWPELIARLTPSQRKSLGKLIDLANPPDFCEYARSLVPSPGTITPDGRLLLHNSVIVWGVLLLQGSSRTEALDLAGRLQQVEAFDVRLMQLLGECAEESGEEVDRIILQGMDVIDNLGPKPRLIMPLMKFLRHPNARIRSKAAKIAGRVTSNQDWINRHFAELDPRVRSNLLEALALNPEFDESRLRDLLQRAAGDPHHRVSVTALFLLARMGDEASLERINALQHDANPALSKAADWAISQLAALKSSPERPSEPAPAQKRPESGAVLA